MAAVSAFYHLPPHVLPSIQLVESGNPGLASRNKDGSADLGVMQINSLWVAPLAQHTSQSQTAVRQRLLHDACFNIAAAGAILRIYLNEEKGNLLRAVGDYHSHKPVRNLSYQLRVLDAATRLFRRGPARK
ncbi:MAG: lytic transglycosylase domain-containing protein [Thiohalocapsa sp.]